MPKLADYLPPGALHVTTAALVTQTMAGKHTTSQMSAYRCVSNEPRYSQKQTLLKNNTAMKSDMTQYN
jgi:hypothetical protein